MNDNTTVKPDLYSQSSCRPRGPVPPTYLRIGLAGVR
jgi:hypothetical protein